MLQHMFPPVDFGQLNEWTYLIEPVKRFTFTVLGREVYPPLIIREFDRFQTLTLIAYFVGMPDVKIEQYCLKHDLWHYESEPCFVCEKYDL